MIISVGFEGENSDGVVWLFPVPADPNKVAIDVVKSLPRLSGEEISKKAKSNLDDTTKFLQMTQVYTIPFVLMSEPLMVGTTSQGLDNALDSKDFGRGVEQDVAVYEHLEKEGIASEIITAKTADGLYDYLKSKGLKIESGSIPVLDNYIGKEYSFVASWISSSEIFLSEDTIRSGLYNFLFKEFSAELPLYTVYNNLKIKYPDVSNYDLNYSNGEIAKQFREEMIAAIKQNPSLISGLIDYKPFSQKGVFVTFPTKDIYFPLLPTSVYGSKTVPATIRVIGYVSPKVFQDIKSYAKAEYYVDSYASFADDLKSFYSGQNQDIKYTKIEINAPSKFLTDDLWINNQAPVKTYYSTFIAEYPITGAIILLILSSIIAGILAGLIIFKDLRKNPVKLGLIGLSNCLTLFGLLITTVLVGTKNKNKSVDLLLAEIKQKGYFWKRRVATILFFVATPFLVFGLFALPSVILEIIYSLSYLAFDLIIPVLVILVIYVFRFNGKFVRLIFKYFTDCFVSFGLAHSSVNS